MRDVRSYSYRVWEKHLEEELQELVKFKTESVLPSGIKRNKNAVWTSSEGGELGTANFAQKEFQSFFGYLCLSKKASDLMFRGKGYSKGKLTIGLLADLDLVESFITGFKKLRSFNKYNNGHIHFLSMVTSLLRPETGYLYQNPKFAVKIGMSGDTEEWQKKCFDTRTRLLEVQADIKHAKNSGSSDFQKGRDPKEPIADILALPNPLTAIKELISIMLSDVNSYPLGIKRAVFYRDILLIALLVGNPLRIKMFAIMKFDRNLIREDDGSWWIKFKRADFKNRSSISSDYEVEIAPEFYPLIERYQREFRPLLFGAEESDYVFLKDSDNRNRKPPRKKRKSLIYKSPPVVKDIYSFTPAVLSGRVSIRIKDYFPLSPGFRAHAFRHIVATSIIKSNPEMGFFLASKVLHDKLETVEREYVHLKTSEFFRPYNRFLSDLLKGVINNDDSGNSSSENGGGGK
jgi:integrase